MQDPLKPEESEEPRRPSDGDCCGSGCSPCVFDVYERQVRDWRNGRDRPAAGRGNCLSELRYEEFELTHVRDDTAESRVYTLEHRGRPHECEVRFSPGQHVLLLGRDEPDGADGRFSRAYTLLPREEGAPPQSLSLLVRLQPGGRMSEVLRALAPGARLACRGPFGGYRADGSVCRLLLVGQGVGVAPLYAVARDLVANERCETAITLLYCCRDEATVHLRAQLHQLAAFWNFRYEVFLAHGGARPAFYAERVHARRLGAADVAAHAAPPCRALLCGGDAFCERARALLRAAGVADGDVFTF